MNQEKYVKGQLMTNKETISLIKDQLLTTEQAAQMLYLKPAQVVKLAQAGEIECLHLTSKVNIYIKCDLERYVEENSRLIERRKFSQFKKEMKKGN